MPKPKDHQGGLTQDHLPDLMLPAIRGRIASDVTDLREDSSSTDQLPTKRIVTQAAPPIPRKSGRAHKATIPFDER